MDYPKFIVSNQKEESICIQKFNILTYDVRLGIFSLQDVTESLDPALRPVLMHETFRRGGLLVIKLGDTEIEYNQNFR